MKDDAPSATPPPANCAFSAVLLAGGKSSRMGRDKAGVVVQGQALWERQLATLRELRPAEIFISGRLDGPYAGAGVEIVQDITPRRGPLSGLEASLQRATQELVVVLAIDLPEMTAGFLLRLVGLAAETGIVPRVDGWFEPLAAIYPRRCLPLVQECLGGEDFSMQGFVQRAVEAGFVKTLDVGAEDAGRFRNVNTPQDVRDA